MPYKPYKPPAVTEGPGGIIDPSKLGPDVVDRVFMRMGGEDRLFAEANADARWFFEKCYFPSVRQKKAVAETGLSVADVLAALDSRIINVTPEEEGEKDEPFDAGEDV